MSFDIDVILRDHVVDGDPESGAHRPSKPQLRQLLKALARSGVAGKVVAHTEAELQSIIGSTDKAGGEVWSDPDPDKNGVYYWDLNAENWVKVAGLQRSVAVLENVGGTASNITGTVNGIAPSEVDALVVFPVVTNTGPVTVSLSGQPDVNLLSPDGAFLSGGEQAANIPMFWIKSGSDWRIAFPANAVSQVEENKALAESARNAAEAAKAAAEGAAETKVTARYNSLAGAAAAVISSAVRSVELTGLYSAGDGLGGTYVDVANGRPVAFVSSGATSRSWYKAKRQSGNAYVGQVATNCVIPNFSNTSNKQIMSRTRHIASDDISGPQLIFPNFYHTGNAEQGVGGRITLTASIEYPEGEFTQVTWSNSTSISISDKSVASPSDEAPVDIPAGATFWVRTYSTSAAGILFTGNDDTLNGERAEFGASGITDKTMGGVINDSGVSATYGPMAIIGTTSKPSVLIVGDSRESAVGFDASNELSALGHIARAVAPICAYSNVSRGGERVAEFVLSNSLRTSIKGYFSHVLIHMGINDFTAGTSAATTLANIDTMLTTFADQEVWMATVEPVSASTDGWVTVANQTADATSQTERVAFNEAIRAGITGVAGYFEFADVMESARNSGLWKAPGGVALTVDGTHSTVEGYQWAQQSGAINAQKLFEAGQFQTRFATREEVAKGLSANTLVTPGSLGSSGFFKAILTADQTLSSGGSAKLAFNDVEFDYLEFFDVANNRWYPPVGNYFAQAFVYISSGVVAEQPHTIRLAKNSATIAEALYKPSVAGAFTMSISHPIKIEMGDYVEVWVNLQGAGDKTVLADGKKTWFSGSRAF